MVELPKTPTLKCGVTEVGIGVVLVYAGSTPATPFPISGAEVVFKYRSFPDVWNVNEIRKNTNILGLAEACIPIGRATEVYARKTGIDFGAGGGEYKEVGRLTTGYTPTLLSPPYFTAKTRAPGLPPPIPVCTPPQIYNPVTGKCETPKPVCTPPQVYNPATGKCETPIPVCTPPQIYNPVTGKCETPTVPCIEWETNAAVSIPSVLKMPYDISISNANWKCKATGAKTPVSTTAEAYIGGHKFYIPISGGAGSLSLSQADIDKIIGAPITPPVTPPVVPTECVKSGKLGVPGTFLVSLAELQAFLNKCFPGATAEPGTGTWTGAYKITRSTGGKYPAGTYFWTTRWEDIKGTY